MDVSLYIKEVGVLLLDHYFKGARLGHVESLRVANLLEGVAALELGAEVEEDFWLII